MKPGDEAILLGFIDGCSYETTGQNNSFQQKSCKNC